MLLAHRHRAVGPVMSIITRLASSAGAAGKEPVVVVSTLNGVRTLRMNNPKRLNAWNATMQAHLYREFDAAAADDDIKVLVITGTGRFYCAGVDLSEGFMKAIGHPAKVYTTVRDNNAALFQRWIDFPKAIIVAANGPVFGASLTTATLSDRFICAPTAEFSTPFNRVAVPPEGCSSYNFPKRLGVRAAEKMLTEDWVPNAKEALEIGLVHEVVEGGPEPLLARAQAIGEELIRTGHKRQSDPKWTEVNNRESHELGKAFVSARFLQAQVDFLESKGKTGPSWAMWIAKSTRPLWSMLLPSEAR